MTSFATDPEAYCPPLSLWRLVEQHVPLHEQDEIKNMLGDSLVELSLELHDEVKILLDIWRDYKEETETRVQSTPKLAEPPHVRERLIQEICFLADNVREKSVKKGLDPVTVLSRHNTRILEYAHDAKRAGTSCPLSARSSDGRQTPISPSSIVSSHESLSCTINENVVSSNAKLNVLEFSGVCDRLRDTLTKEIAQLEGDISFLHSCLEDEAEFRSSGSISLSREPTLTDLREERTLLEKELLSSEKVLSVPVSKAIFSPGEHANMKPPNFTRLRPVHPASSISKPSPLKASHNLGRFSASQNPTFQDHHSDTRVPDGDDKDQRKKGNASEVVLKSLAPRVYPVLSTHSDTASADSEESCARTKNFVGMKEQDLFYDESSSGSQHRNRSPGRVKIVPVGSILDPLRDSPDCRQLIPTPPTKDKPRLRRPTSAERFRKTVMQCREGN